MSENVTVSATSPGYRRLRLRRWLFWLVLIVYLPMMLVAQKLFPGKQALVTAFCIWLGMLVVSALAVALVRCPACGQTFHMNGMTFLPVRRCLHCGVHIKQLAKESS